MKPSIIKGKLLPQSLEDFMTLAEQNPGWMETQISGSCEPCYDDLCAEIDEEDSDEEDSDV